MAPPQLSRSHSHHHRSSKRVVEKRETKLYNSSPISTPFVPQRSASFHGRTAVAAAAAERVNIRRPRTQPELLGKVAANDLEGMKFGQLTRVPNKVLVNVSVQGCLLGSLQVLASSEWNVHQLVDAAIKLYVKEKRRPALPTVEPSAYGLHYSQFSLEALDPNEKLIGLGSRNFFLCPKALNPTAVAADAASSSAPSSSSCSDQAGKEDSKFGIPWLRFIENILL